jgi:murein DD-endopeptidase MepM/ murein hydrolase activator NlpD
MNMGHSSELIVPAKDINSAPASNLSELAQQISCTDSNSSEPEERERVLQISSGDTMLSLLGRIGVSKEEATKAIEAMKRVYDLRELKVGQDINVKYRKDKGDAALLSLSFKASHDNEIMLNENDGAFLAKKYQIALKKVQKVVEGTIDSSFYSAALKRGVPAQVIRDAINALAYDINWQHDPARGDPFKIVYEVDQDTNGNAVRAGHLKFVSFAPGGGNASKNAKNNIRQVYRFQPANGTPGYYDANGANVVRTLLQTPLDPSKLKITSKFNARGRQHPILGFSRAHLGVDYGAARGTPVRAAGDGVVIAASYSGQYGNRIEIKHNGEFNTLYAHLNSMKVKPGMKVRQNQLIGTVGSTGLATGPHLHFELKRHGKQVNPSTIKHVPTSRLNAKDLTEFRRVKAQIEKEATESPTTPAQVASVDSNTRRS